MAMSSSDIKLSIHEGIVKILTDPANWATPYNVYGWEELQNQAFTPTFPYVFVIARRLPIEPRLLPILALNTNVGSAQLQLGSSDKLARVSIHIWPNSEGEGDRLADAIIEHFMSVMIWRRTAGETTEYGVQEFDDDWMPSVVPIPDTYVKQGTLTHWIEMSNDLEVFL